MVNKYGSKQGDKIWQQFKGVTIAPLPEVTI